MRPARPTAPVMPRSRAPTARLSRRRPPPSPALRKAVGRVARGVREALDNLRELLEALVGLPVLPRRVARIDALEDDRQLPEAERDEEVDLGQVAARALGVALPDVVAGGEAGGDRRGR